jgi:predicted MFS family arabinose efflux permease
VACCTEVPAFRFQGKLLESVSLDSVVHLVLLTIALRLGLYSALPGWGSVWGVLPVELLHGITYALAFGCGTMYASKVAPPGRGASMQGVFQATYLSIGGGLGGLLGGLLLESQGGATLFSTSALLVLGGWAAAWAAEVALKQVGSSRQQQQADVVAAGVQPQRVGGAPLTPGDSQGVQWRRRLGKKTA